MRYSRESDPDDVAYFYTLSSQSVRIDDMVAGKAGLCLALEPMLEHAKDTTSL